MRSTAVARAMSPLDVVAFAGEAAVSANLSSGPARDLNLMLRRGRVEATMEPLVLDAEHSLAVDDSLIVLCVIDGSLAVESDGARVVLDTLDSAVIEPGERGEVTLLPSGRTVVARIAIRA